ncbi:MAG TPA: acyl-CoA reductase, partial [Longimicrobiales bacterium]
MTFDAFHLPSLDSKDYDGWIEWNGARAPRLNPAGVTRLTNRLRDAGQVLHARTVDDIVALIDQAVSRITDDATERTRAVELVARFSSCSVPMAAHIFDRMTADWRAPSLLRMLDGEFRDRHMLDTFRPDGTGRLLHASGARIALHIFSGNVPGVGVTSIIRSLLVKCPVLGKTAASEPVLPVIFATALAAIDPEIGRAVAVTYWPGGTTDLEDAVLPAVEQVVHYGGRDSIGDMSRRVPANVPLITHGPRISFGMVGQKALGSPDDAASLAGDIAYATAVFDQQGCVSPHTVFVEERGAVSPPELAGLVERALERLSRDLPPAALAQADAIAIREFRALAEFRAINGEKVLVLGPDRLDHTIIFDPVPEL